MYVNPNYKTKKALKEAVKNNEAISVYQPNNVFKVTPPENGEVAVEGPHYPKPHTWYARVTLKDGKIIQVK